MRDLALLVGSVIVGAVIAVVADRDYQRRAASARNVSVRSHLFSAIMLVLSAAVVGVGAILDEGKRVFTIPFSVIVGFVGLALLVRLARDLSTSK